VEPVQLSTRTPLHQSAVQHAGTGATTARAVAIIQEIQYPNPPATIVIVLDHAAMHTAMICGTVRIVMIGIRAGRNFARFVVLHDHDLLTEAFDFWSADLPWLAGLRSSGGSW